MTRALADLVRVAGVLSTVVAVTMGGVPTALFALVLLGLTLLRVARVPAGLDLATGTLLVAAAWCALLDAYLRYPWLDLVMHFCATGLVAAAGHLALVRAGAAPGPDSGLRRPRLAVVVHTASLGVALAVLWELGEWYGHARLDPAIQTGYVDTMGDLAAGALGSLLAGLLAARHRLPSRPPAAGRPATVSVVIPVKDDAGPLRRCLSLLERQTVLPEEVIVVDNGSTDDTAEVARSFGARVVTEPAPGIPAAAATGYDAARGEVIARCDADSAPSPDWLARIVGAMTEDPGLDAVTGSGWFYDVPRITDGVLRGAYLGTYYATVHLALGHTAVWGSNMAFRRSAWLRVREAVHRADPELHDDIDLAFALGPAGRIRYDRSLRVGVSARCVRGGVPQLRQRLARAVRTLRVNWAELPPWLRWQSRLTRRTPV